MTDKRPDDLLKEGNVRGEVKGGVERNETSPTIKPKAPPPAPTKNVIPPLLT